MPKTKEKSDLKKIVITIDMGASKTKAIVQEYPEGKPVVLLLDSEIADVAKASVESVQQEGSPESRAWVGIGDEYYALGELARRRFGGISQLRELKYELAVPKICGAFWLAKEKLNLGNDVAAYLSVLLPPGEVQDKEQLQIRLKDTFRGFDTPAGKMRVKMLRYDAASEGSGIFFHRRRTLGDRVPVSMYVMLGYRNASIFTFRSGSIGAGITSNFGMSWLVNNLISKTSGLSPDNSNIIEVLIEAGASCDPQVMQKLSRKRKGDEIQLDGESMSKALLLARDEYWRAIARWLRSKMDEDIEELVFCGGTADYIRPEIDAYFQKEGIKVSWHANIFIPDEISSGMGNRIADVWAFHQHMIIQFDKLTGYIRSEVVLLTKSVEGNTNNAGAEVKRRYNFTPCERPSTFIAVNENV
ncbi:ParM/StbA family protein [Nostoc parmelioides]|uniref:ParM/StbA family protein n=1 Tax=Nostoc parmelioides FACHB-3921 TaxID=2692909 RepID=A0ABR8BJW1_9NOSO|nr:ParM/StbA family protein [Nostoc parmelioides]MBD2254382.1 ParM/StbA family protein [Nostoc parmelioides FACHB-3921]